MSTSNFAHPWRMARIDGAGVRRSNTFSRYLQGLPPAERRVIEAAERAYVERSRDPNGRHASAQRDFDESLKGLKDEEREVA